MNAPTAYSTERDWFYREPRVDTQLPIGTRITVTLPPKEGTLATIIGYHLQPTGQLEYEPDEWYHICPDGGYSGGKEWIINRKWFKVIE